MHPAAFAGATAVEQRHADAQRQQIARGKIRDRDAHPHRALFGKPGNRHEAAHALRDLIDSAAFAIGAGLPETTDAAVHEARIDFIKVIPADLEPLFDRGAHVFHHHVGAFDQTQKDRIAFRRFQIEADRPFVAMQILEIRAMPASDDILAGSNRRFDTYHVSAPIREMPHARWARARQREVEHHDAR